MANPDNSGKIVGFTMSQDEMERRINEYKRMVRDGKIELPYWTDFREFLGVRQEVLDEVVERGYYAEGAQESAYHGRALMLKSMGETCENYLATHPNWSGKNAVKSMMLLKQGLGWTKKYIDERTASKGGPTSFSISFGGSDPRAKKAAK